MVNKEIEIKEVHHKLQIQIRTMNQTIKEIKIVKMDKMIKNLKPQVKMDLIHKIQMEITSQSKEVIPVKMATIMMMTMRIQ